jgi:hypothetical protein
MYELLPKREKTFKIDVIGEDSGIHYEGDFTVKTILTMSGRHTLELEKTRLMADYANPSRGLIGLSVSLATIRAKIVKAPSWWEEQKQGAEIIDENVILEIYDKTVKAEQDWRDLIAKRAEQAKQEQEQEDREKKESEGK